jgi:hypothetical protein
MSTAWLGMQKLIVQDSQIKLSHFEAVFENAWQRPDRFHACSCAPPLYFGRQRFEKAWPVSNLVAFRPKRRDNSE